MQGPQEGEPYFDYPGPAVSIGDMGAMPGTDAWRATTVVDLLGVPSHNIIDTGSPFNLRVIVRTAGIGGYPLPPGLSGSFHFLNLLTGAAAAGLFPATGPTPIVAPIGDSGVRGVGDVVGWNEFTATGLTLPDGTYRIIVHGIDAASGLMFFHDGTVIHVGN